MVKIDGAIERVTILRNGYNFTYKGERFHLVDGIGEKVKLERHQVIKVTIIDGTLIKARTKKGILNICAGDVANDSKKYQLHKRTINYQQTIKFTGDQWVLTKLDGERFIGIVNSEVDVLTIDGVITSVSCNGNTYIPISTTKCKGKYKIPKSKLAAT